MNKYKALDIENSRFYDPLAMSGQQTARRATPTDSRDALKAAIEHYGDVRQLGGHSAAVKRALAACMQILDQK